MSDELAERMAIMEYDGGMPRPWAEWLARLCTAPKPEGYNERRWGEIVEDACRFATHLPKVIRNGWSIADIRKLLPQLNGRRVVAIGMGDVSVATPQGDVRIYRRPNSDGSATWTEGRRG